MVVIIIVGILAAVAVPLYTDYIEKARVTEATSIMGAIITSQKIELQRTNRFYTAGGQDPAQAAAYIAEFRPRGIDIGDTRYFVYETGGDPLVAGAFYAVGTSTPEFSAAAVGWIRYDYNPANTPAGTWTCDTALITNDMLPISPAP